MPLSEGVRNKSQKCISSEITLAVFKQKLGSRIGIQTTQLVVYLQRRSIVTSAPFGEEYFWDSGYEENESDGIPYEHQHHTLWCIIDHRNKWKRGRKKKGKGLGRRRNGECKTVQPESTFLTDEATLKKKKLPIKLTYKYNRGVPTFKLTLTSCSLYTAGVMRDQWVQGTTPTTTSEARI
jgi:hypothetical protein